MKRWFPFLFLLLAAGAYTFHCDKSFLGMSHRGKGMEGKMEARGE